MNSKRSSMPPLNAVRVFEAAIRHQSFTRAAEELGMTQAAVSYQIKQLEQRLGLTLFQRASRKVELTRAGERLAAPVVDAFRALRTAFSEEVERSQSELAITSLPTIASHWLVPKLGEFRQAHSHLTISLDTSVPLVDLTQSDFDIGIRMGRGEWPDTTAHFLLPNMYTPLCSRALFDSGALASPADLLKLPRMGRERWWREWFVAAGVADADLSTRPGVELAVESFEVTAAIAGHGVAMTSPLFFRQEIASGRLVQPFSLVLRDERDYWLAYPTARRNSGKIQAFRAWILDQAKREPAIKTTQPRAKG